MLRPFRPFFFFSVMVNQHKQMKLFSDDAWTYSSSYSGCLVSMICWCVYLVWTTGADCGGRPIPTDGRYSVIFTLAPSAGLILPSDAYYQQQHTTNFIPAAGRYHRIFKKKKTLFSFQIFYWNNGHFLNVGVCSVVLQTGECATECFCLRCPPLKSDSSIAIATGQYVLLWRRYVFPDTHTKRKKSWVHE